MRVIPGDTMPAIDARLAGGGRWALAREKPAKLSLLAFYRGIFCPICRTWLADLDRLAPQFEKRGVSVIALSCDRWSARPKASSPTAAFDMTHWMNPVPSRSVRKWILPLDRRLCSQPCRVTCWPS